MPLVLKNNFRATRNRGGQRAFAILLVVLVLAALAVIAAPFAITMSQHRWESRSLVARVRARAAAEGAARWAFISLLRGYETYEAQNFGLFSSPMVDSPHEVKIDFPRPADVQGADDYILEAYNPRGVLLSAQAWDEQGKINLNHHDEEPVLTLFSMLGISDDVANQALSYSRNIRPFRSLDEITMAAPIGVDVVERLRPHATVHSLSPVIGTPPPININTATVEVVTALLTSVGHATLEQAAFVAMQLKGARSRLREAVAAGVPGGQGVFLLLEDATVLPSNGWVAVEGDLVHYGDRDTTAHALLMIDEHPENGVSVDHPAGAEVRFVLTSPADVFRFLTELSGRYPDELPPPVVEPLFNALFAPGAVPLCFRSYNVYSVDAKAMVNEPSGIEAAREALYNVVHAVPLGRQTWHLTSQAELEEFRRLMPATIQDKFVTTPNTMSILDEDPDAGRLNERPLETGLSPGASTISLGSTEKLSAGDRVKLISSANPEILDYARIVRVVDATTVEVEGDTGLELDPVEYDFTSGGTVRDAGGVRPVPASVDEAGSTFVLHFSANRREDLLVASPSSGTAEPRAPVAGSLKPGYVDVEGVRVLTVERALEYRANDGNLPSQPRGGQRIDLLPGAIEFWFKPHWPDRSQSRVLFDMAEDRYLNRIAIVYNGETRQLVFRIADNTLEEKAVEIRADVTDQPTEPSGPDSPVPLLNDTWYHLLAVWSGISYNEMALFLDSRSVGRYWPATRLASDLSSTSLAAPSYEDSGVIPQHGPVLVDGEVIDVTPEGVIRGARGTTARQHRRGVPAIPYGYESIIVRERSGGGGYWFPDDTLMTRSQWSQTQEPLWDAPVTARMNLTHPDGPIVRDVESNGQRIADGRLLPDAPWIPITADPAESGQVSLAANPHPPGYVFAGSERVFYRNVQQATIPVIVRITVQTEQGPREVEVERALDTWALTDLERGVLGTMAATLSSGTQVSKISLRVDDNTHYPRGDFSLPRTYDVTLPDTGETYSHTYGGASSPALVELDDEWVGYHFPSRQPRDEHERATFEGQHYLIGLTGLARAQGNTAIDSHAAGTLMAPVFQCEQGGTGRFDRVTLTDDQAGNRSGREELEIKWAATLDGWWCVSFTTGISGSYRYDRTSRILKFPSRTLPQTLQEYFSIGKNALDGTAAAGATFDEFKISSTAASVCRLLDVRTSADYRDIGGDPEPDPPSDKQIPYRGSMRLDVQIPENLEPPFSLMVGSLSYSGPYDDSQVPRFVNPVSLPRHGYLKVGDECMFFHALYSRAGSSVEGQGSFSTSSTTIEVTTTDGYPLHGYAAIHALHRSTNSNYASWLNDPDILQAIREQFGDDEDAYNSFLSRFTSNQFSETTTTEYVFYERSNGTADGILPNLQRGILDTSPTSGSATLGFTVNPISVEIEILERAALGTSTTAHPVGEPVLLLNHIPAAVITRPLEVDPDGDSGIARLAIAPTGLSVASSGVLQVGPEREAELLAYTNRSGNTLIVPLGLRERFGTTRRTLNAADVLADVIQPIELDDQGYPTDPTPAYGFGPQPAERIVRFISWRYWDGLPVPDAQDEPVNYDGPGAVYYRIGKVCPGIYVHGLTWEATLPETGFGVRAIVRVNSTTAPDWNADPAETCPDGKEDGLIQVDSPPDVPPDNLNNIRAAGNDVEVRLFFVYPDDAFSFTSWLANAWKKAPTIESITMTYELFSDDGQVLYRKSLGY